MHHLHRRSKKANKKKVKIKASDEDIRREEGENAQNAALNNYQFVSIFCMKQHFVLLITFLGISLSSPLLFCPFQSFFIFCFSAFGSFKFASFFSLCHSLSLTDHLCIKKFLRLEITNSQQAMLGELTRN